MSWRLANSLVVLRKQINEAYPNRSKVSDGTIGDAAHQSDKTSDHNPNAQDVVCAFDITHDPANELDIDILSNTLAQSRDPRIKYMIANKLILVPADYGWTWQPYTGTDPHTSHLHISVYGDYDDETKWKLGDTNMKEDAVRYSILGVTGGEELKEYEKEVRYWTGRDQVEFARYLYALGDSYALELRKQLKIADEKVSAKQSPSDKAIAALKEALK